MTDARVVVLRDYGLLEIEEIALPRVGAYQVSVELLAAGIQQAQLSMVQSSSSDQDPVVPGLEGVGVIRAVGAEVSRVKVGDLVVVCPTPAGLNGREVATSALTFTSGQRQIETIYTWATNAVLDECFVVPTAISTADREALAIIGDTVLRSTAVILRGAGVVAGDAVLVCGCGGAGLAAVAAAKAAGAGRIVAVGDSASGLEKARMLGATERLSSADQAEPGSIDHLIDCVGEFEGAAVSRTVLRKGGGAHVIAPLGTAEMATRHQARVTDLAAAPSPVGEPDLDLATILAWIEAGDFDPSKLVQRRYTIEQINEAILDLETDPTAGLPIMVVEPVR